MMLSLSVSCARSLAAALLTIFLRARWCFRMLMGGFLRATSWVWSIYELSASCCFYCMETSARAWQTQTCVQISTRVLYVILRSGSTVYLSPLRIQMRPKYTQRRSARRRKEERRWSGVCCHSDWERESFNVAARPGTPFPQSEPGVQEDETGLKKDDARVPRWAFLPPNISPLTF